jgi:putative oxidoreductase
LIADLLNIPQLAVLSAALAPWAEALLRVVVGLSLMPHALRMAFGFFPGSPGPVKNLTELADFLGKTGYRPGMLWGVIIVLTELVAGPMLAVGFLTQLACIPIFILMVLSVVTHSRFGWFWDHLGIEYPVLWTACVFYFLVNGGGYFSVDRLIGLSF